MLLYMSVLWVAALILAGTASLALGFRVMNIL